MERPRCVRGDAVHIFHFYHLFFDVVSYQFQTIQLQITIMSTEATKQQAIHYGCLVINPQTGAVNHYVEKPSSYVSTFINCGIYVCSLDIFSRIASVFHSRDLCYSTHGNGHNRDQGYIEWEREVLTRLAGTGKLFALPVNNWWSQIKTAGSAIYANRHFLEMYRHRRTKAIDGDEAHPVCNIIGDVYIHPSATIHPTAMVNTQRKHLIGIGEAIDDFV